jgi:hypothetical protein
MNFSKTKMTKNITLENLNKAIKSKAKTRGFLKIALKIRLFLAFFGIVKFQNPNIFVSFVFLQNKTFFQLRNFFLLSQKKFCRSI